jgi:hypothetical protein
MLAWRTRKVLLAERNISTTTRTSMKKERRSLLFVVEKFLIALYRVVA